MARHVGPSGLVEWGYYGDWLSLEGLPHPQVTGWSHILGVQRMVDLANLTSNIKDAAYYATYLATLKTKYHDVFYDAVKGCYKGGSQTAQILPLYLDITPPSAVPSVVKALVCGPHLDLGRAPYALYGVKCIDLVSLVLLSGGQHQQAWQHHDGALPYLCP